MNELYYLKNVQVWLVLVLTPFLDGVKGEGVKWLHYISHLSFFFNCTLFKIKKKKFCLPYKGGIWQWDWNFSQVRFDIFIMT